MANLTLTIRDLGLRAVSVPLARPLVTRVAKFERAPMLLLDLLTEEGVGGRVYLFGYTARGLIHMAGLLRDIVELTRGDTVAPGDIYRKARKGLTMLGHQGLTMMAVSGFDMVCWDARARAVGKPLAALLGGRVEPIRAYNSNGLGIVAPEAAAEEAVTLVEEGAFEAIKIRLGRPTLEADLATVASVRDAVGDTVLLPCDFNQCLAVKEAIRRGRALDKASVYWIEEPVVYDDLKGNAAVARAVTTPIQIGENFYGPESVADAIAAEAGDYLMVDAQRIGGVTGWLRAAALAEAAGLPLSSHLFPEISAHLLAVTPTRHWLEYVDWAAPILAKPARVEHGHLIPSDAPGFGLEWNEDALARHAIPL